MEDNFSKNFINVTDKYLGMLIGFLVMTVGFAFAGRGLSILFGSVKLENCFDAASYFAPMETLGGLLLLVTGILFLKKKAKIEV
jgi:hypothetical protein